MIIRPAEEKDFKDIDHIYEISRYYMRVCGNNEQWANNYPKADIIENDIAQKKLYVCERGPLVFQESMLTEPVNGYEVEGGSGNAHAAVDAVRDFAAAHQKEINIFGVFYFAPETESAYEHIDGSWLNDEPYAVIHRMGTEKRRRGTGKFCMEWAIKKAEELGLGGGIRVDTHEKNTAMRGLLTHMGFSECGIITYPEYGERIAYQRI